MADSWELRFQKSSNYSLSDEWFARPKLLVESKLWLMSNTCFPSGSMELWYVLCNRSLCDQLQLYRGHRVSNKLLWSKTLHMHVCLIVPNSKRPHGLYAAHQALLAMEFSRQESWSGLPFPPLGIFLTQGYTAHIACIAGRFFTAEPRGSPPKHFTCFVTVYWWSNRSYVTPRGEDSWKLALGFLQILPHVPFLFRWFYFAYVHHNAVSTTVY